MPPRRNSRVALVTVILSAGVLCGCNLLIPPIILAGPPTKPVQAEFSRLTDRKVAVHVWAPPQILNVYPYARLDTAKYVAGRLRAEIDDVTLVSTRKVEDYVARAPDQTTDPGELGSHFDAEMVVYIELYKYQMRDPGTPQLFRGFITGSVVVYDLTTSGGFPERYELSSARAVYPPSGPVSVMKTTEQKVRKETSELFAEEVSLKFRDHRVEL